MYKGHKWAFIEEHIHDVLGKQCRDTGDFDAALQHFSAMLDCPHSPPYWQSHYLKQFMETIAAAGSAKVPHFMPSCASACTHFHVIRILAFVRAYLGVSDRVKPAQQGRLY